MSIGTPAAVTWSQVAIPVSQPVAPGLGDWEFMMADEVGITIGVYDW